MKIKRTAEQINSDINASIDKKEKSKLRMETADKNSQEFAFAMSDFYEAKGAIEALKWVLGEMI